MPKIAALLGYDIGFLFQRDGKFKIDWRRSSRKTGIIFYSTWRNFCPDSATVAARAERRFATNTWSIGTPPSQRRWRNSTNLPGPKGIRPCVANGLPSCLCSCSKPDFLHSSRSRTAPLKGNSPIIHACMRSICATLHRCSAAASQRSSRRLTKRGSNHRLRINHGDIKSTMIYLKGVRSKMQLIR